MSRLYTATLRSIPLTAITVEDLAEINAAAEQPVTLIGLVITQAGDSSDSGDANEDQIDVVISRVTGSPTSGSGGTVVVPTRSDSGDTLFGGVVEMGNTTNLSGGTLEEWWAEGFNNRVGLFHWPVPKAQITIRGDETLIIRTTALHTNAHEVNVVVLLEEIG